jgi:methyl halide transferase
LTNSNVNNPFFWNSKYKNNDDRWDIGKPTPIFKNWSSTFINPQDIKICIPGCGNGHDAIFLANKGFNVYAFDFSKEAINNLNSKVENGFSIETFCIDFFNISNDFYSYFDYILEYTFYCAISPQKRSDYISQCHRLLKKNGRIISIMLPIGGNIEKLVGPPFEVTKQELRSNFISKFKVIKIEKSNLSIKPRKDIELYAEYEKK